MNFQMICFNALNDSMSIAVDVVIIIYIYQLHKYESYILYVKNKQIFYLVLYWKCLLMAKEKH